MVYYSLITRYSLILTRYFLAALCNWEIEMKIRFYFQLILFRGNFAAKAEKCNILYKTIAKARINFDRGPVANVTVFYCNFAAKAAKL